jgi:transcriptional regulator with GAF, ATPase, and Fis domain
VGEIPLELQSKLLRVLQEQQYERVGEEQTRQVDVRIIAATNRDLQKEVEAGRFRQDLYYRLNVYPIEVPPLRNRKEDIPLIAAHLLGLAAKRLNCNKPRLTQAHVVTLQNYDWPGNVRELQNVIERAIITWRGDNIYFDIPTVGKSTACLEPIREKKLRNEMDIIPEAQMQRFECDNILAALSRSSGKISGPGGAAQLLGVKPTTLISRIKKLGIKRPVL